GYNLGPVIGYVGIGLSESVPRLVGSFVVVDRVGWLAHTCVHDAEEIAKPCQIAPKTLDGWVLFDQLFHDSLERHKAGVSLGRVRHPDNIPNVTAPPDHATLQGAEFLGLRVAVGQFLKYCRALLERLDPVLPHGDFDLDN